MIIKIACMAIFKCTKKSTFTHPREMPLIVMQNLLVISKKTFLLKGAKCFHLGEQGNWKGTRKPGSDFVMDVKLPS